MPRLFIAFEIAEDVLDAVQDELRRLKQTGADVRWAARDHLHVTLRFLGEVPEESIGAVEEMLVAACARFGRMDLEARGVGTFPAGARPRVVWVGVQGKDEAHRAALHGLRSAVHDGASALGFPTDRDEFRPHLTLGRVKGPAKIRPLVDLVREDRDREFGRFEVGELVLFRSQLSRDGSVYTALRRAPLGPG
jgi:RNA 2',3'-cyclic 3'-phosphodiesterase